MYRKCLLLFLLSVFPVALAARADSDFGRFHALVIGNQNYRHLKSLKTPLADARAVAAVLENKYGFEVELLLDKTREEIVLAIDRLCDSRNYESGIREKDSLLIYYAGHGSLDKANGLGYWQPVDATSRDVHWIPTLWITRKLKCVQARHVLVVSDSCYSGGLLERGLGKPRRRTRIGWEKWLRRMWQGKSYTALTSGGQETVPDSGGGGHSVFAGAFLEVLRQNRDTLDGNSLFDQIKTAVVGISDQTPKYNYIPGTKKNEGDFILVPKELQGNTVQEPEPDDPEDLRAVLRRGDTMTDPITGMELIYIPKGCFQMGSNNGNNDERQVHTVCVKGFWMGKYEVTQGQWKKIMQENPAHFQKGDDYPVEKVSWDDAQKFIGKLNAQSNRNYRLPTEAEWEYACRANGSGRYCGGDDLDALAWYGKNSGKSTHPVGGKRANAFALHDMSGNVWEWCVDWYGKNYYRSSPKDNPTGPSSGPYRVLRGGSWCNRYRVVRAAYRYRLRPADRDYSLGFRLALSVQQGR